MIIIIIIIIIVRKQLLWKKEINALDEILLRKRDGRNYGNDSRPILNKNVVVIVASDEK